MTETIPLITAALGFSQAAIWAGFLVFLRIGAAMALLPGFGEQSVPQRIRLALALCFSAIVAPAVAPSLIGLKIPLYLALGTEVVAGLALGIGLRLFVFALQIAGTIAAQSTSLAQAFGGFGAEPQPAMSHLFVVAGLCLAVLAGLHIRIATLLILSYDLLPPGQILAGDLMAKWGLSLVSHCFSLAFSLAVPFVAASVIYNVALGVINRAMPQLMVVFVGAPALTLGGLMLLALTTPILLQVWLSAFHLYLANPFTVPP